MAFAHRILAQSPDTGDPILLIVDSIIDEQIEVSSDDQIASLNDLETSLKRQIEPTTMITDTKAKKSVRFAAQVSPSTSPPPPSQWPPSSAPIRRVSNNFCDNLLQCFRQPSQAKSLLLLEGTAYGKQLVYPSQVTPSDRNQKPISLRKLITATNDPNFNSAVLLHERVALARKFATAVLQYHATPWMQLAWRSDDILLFDARDNEQIQTRLSFSAPYIHAKIQQQIDHSPMKRPTMARNPFFSALVS